MHDEPTKAKDTDWQCATCGDWKPVQQLARECETRHAKEAEQWQAA